MRACNKLLRRRIRREEGLKSGTTSIVQYTRRNAANDQNGTARPGAMEPIASAMLAAIAVSMANIRSTKMPSKSNLSRIIPVPRLRRGWRGTSARPAADAAATGSSERPVRRLGSTPVPAWQARLRGSRPQQSRTVLAQILTSPSFQACKPISAAQPIQQQSTAVQCLDYTARTKHTHW